MRIITIIQARTGSTRLPGKIFKEIGDKTLLRMVVERCLKANVPEKVVVAYHDEDRILPEEEYGVPVVGGPEEPAARFLKVLTEYPCDGFVRVCADSPFIDWGIVDEAAVGLTEGLNYYNPGPLTLSNLPLVHGNQAEGFDTTAFLKAESRMVGEEREHLGMYFERQGCLTVDTPADLERARLIVSRMDKDHTEYTAAECLSLLHG
jgi:spore coat polysaccharide biosynthesis protein SpsF